MQITNETAMTGPCDEILLSTTVPLSMMRTIDDKRDSSSLQLDLCCFGHHFHQF